MDQEQTHTVCEAFALGTPIGEPQGVPGGLLHHMWRMETESGIYAVKEISSAYLHRPESAEIITTTERIAAAMAHAGIPAIPALSPSMSAASPLLPAGDASFLVYPWVEGQTLPLGAVDVSAAQTIGALLGRIHRVQMSGDIWQTRPIEIHAFQDDSWVLLARRGAALELPWAAALREATLRLAVWNARYRRSAGALLRTAVVSHRDLDQKNVLWRGPDNPALVDWESAGAINPAVELAGVALDWSGIGIGEPVPDVFRAVVAGYRSTGAAFTTDPRDALYAQLAHWMAWLKFNLYRSLGEIPTETLERDIGTHEAINTLAALERLASGVDLYASWLRA